MPPEDPPNLADIDPALLDRLLSGTATDAETARFAAWGAAHPALADEIERLRSTLADAMPLQSRSLAELKRRAEAMRRTAGAPRLLPVSARGISAWRTGIAASILLMAVAAIWQFGRGHAPLQQFKEFTTTAGNRASVVLRDGTRLVLAPASRLRVPDDFGIQRRTLNLEGEAMFDVVHDASRPFTVRTSRATVEDIGTRFDVRAYADDRTTRVAVVEGQVAIAAHGSRLLAGRGDVAVVDSAAAVTHGADMAAVTAWMQGGLAFNRTRLVDVAREVARTFDLNVAIADSSLSNQLVTATFGSESADEVLDEVTSIVGARYERDGRRVVIRRRVGSTEQAPARRAPAPLQTLSDKVGPGSPR